MSSDDAISNGNGDDLFERITYYKEMFVFKCVCVSSMITRATTTTAMIIMISNLHFNPS